MEKKSLRTAYGETLIQLGGEMKNLVVLDADLASATMTKMFKKAYPDRFFDFGIAEANMVCEAVGMVLYLKFNNLSKNTKTSDDGAHLGALGKWSNLQVPTILAIRLFSSP